MLHNDHQKLVKDTLKEDSAMKWSILGKYKTTKFSDYVKDIYTMCVLMGKPKDEEEWRKVLIYRNSIVHSGQDYGFKKILNEMDSWSILCNLKTNPIDEDTMIDFHLSLNKNTRIGDRNTKMMVIKHPQFALDHIVIHWCGGYWLKCCNLLVVSKNDQRKRKGIFYGGNCDPVSTIDPYGYACIYAKSKVARLCE